MQAKDTALYRAGTENKTAQLHWWWYLCTAAWTLHTMLQRNGAIFAGYVHLLYYLFGITYCHILQDEECSYQGSYSVWHSANPHSYLNCYFIDLLVCTSVYFHRYIILLCCVNFYIDWLELSWCSSITWSENRKSFLVCLVCCELGMCVVLL